MLGLRLGLDSGKAFGAAAAAGRILFPRLVGFMLLFGLGACFQSLPGLDDALQPLFAPPQFGRQLVAPTVAPVALVLVLVGLLGFGQQPP